MFRDKESFGRIICELSLVNERCSLNCRFGARYKFDAVLNVFTFFEGEDLEVGKIFSEQVWLKWAFNEGFTHKSKNLRIKIKSINQISSKSKSLKIQLSKSMT